MRQLASDRLSILRVKRISQGQKIPERQLLLQISDNRNGLLRELLEKLNRIVAYLKNHDINQDCVDFRLADFATLGKAIWAALGDSKAVNTWFNILDKMQIEQQDFALEGDPLPEVILEWMGNEVEKGPISPSNLFSELLTTAVEKGISFDYKNSLAIARRLSNIKSILEERFGIKITQKTGRANVTLRTFTKIESEDKRYG